MRGTYLEPGQFNYANSWKPMRDFLGSIDKVKEANWASILRFHGDTNADSEEDNNVICADQSTLSAFRAGIYISSSPIKA
jgi:hypothetical protein